jgi:hypothetical protein
MTEANDSDSVAGWLDRARENGDLELNRSGRCRICKEPLAIGLVNQMIAVGYTLPDIVSALGAHNLKLVSEGKRPITYDCVRRHRERHFDMQAPAAAIYRKIQEKRAMEHGQDVAEGIGTILNHVSFLETIAVRGYEDLVNPETKVSYKDGAEASLKLHELARKDEGAYERAEMLARMARVIELVREFVPADQWPALQARLRGEEVEQFKQPEVVQSVRVIEIDDSPDVEE